MVFFSCFFTIIFSYKVNLIQLIKKINLKKKQKNRNNSSVVIYLSCFKNSDIILIFQWYKLVQNCTLRQIARAFVLCTNIGCVKSINRLKMRNCMKHQNRMQIVFSIYKIVFIIILTFNKR